MEDYFISSLDGPIPLGANDIETMYRAMESASIFIEIITPTFFERPRCLQEVGFMTARKRLAESGRLGEQKVDILPMTVPPMDPQRVNATLDRSQCPVMDNENGLRLFASEVYSALVRLGHRISFSTWSSAVDKFVPAWLEIALDMDGRVRSLLEAYLPLSNADIERLARNPEKIATICEGLPADRLRLICRQFIKSGYPDTGVEVARQITGASVERFGAVKEALAVDPSVATGAELLALTENFAVPYLVKMAKILIERHDYIEGGKCGEKILLNDDSRLEVFAMMVNEYSRMGYLAPGTDDPLVSLYRTFEDHYETKARRYALQAGIEGDWLEEAEKPDGDQ